MVVKINYNSEDICRIIKGRWLSQANRTNLEFLSVDSRKYSDPSNTIFWALAGDGRDGSDFIEELYQKGVRNFVTQKQISTSRLKGANVIRVPDALEALQSLATIHRRKFKHIHVIGITGSNGKTIVKEWMADLLSKHYNIIKNPRSYNSQLGVALSILQIREEHEIGIFEAGISQPGEMQKLAKMILPDTGILTNIGTAHDEGFENRRQKIEEKLSLFQKAKALVYPGGQPLIEDAIQNASMLVSVQKISCGKDHSTLKTTIQKKEGGHTAIQIKYEKKTHRINIPFQDDASIENSINCFCGIMASGKFSEDIIAGFEKLHPVSMRLELKPGKNQSSIINDSYSNDLQSLGIAVDFLKQQSHKKSTVILSDLLQSGVPLDELYKQVAAILIQRKTNRLIAIGPDISAHQKLFKKIPEHYFFSSTKDFLEHLNSFHFHDEAILVKGARKFSFEKISKSLEAQLHQTVLSVNLSNLAHNIRTYKSLLKPGTKLMAMVKAFAYGSGIEQVGSLLQHAKVDYLTVAYTDEGVALREAGIHLPVMVLNVEPESFDNLIKYNLEPELFSFEMLRTFTAYLSNRNISAFPVHIKIDTGMHRLGFERRDIGKLVKELKANKRIKIKSVFSHLSSSDNPANDDFTKSQFHLFNSIVSRLKSGITYPFLCHISNTAAISRFPGLQMDMVRLGIGMYGIESDINLKGKLKIVNQLTTTVSQIKKVKAGEVVGYGRNEVKEDKTIATVRIGYADGYPRILGNGKGKMIVNGKTAPTVGNICMDMTMLDISDIPNLSEGDEVMVFGNKLPVQKVASWAKTIPYEIFTGISPRVRRVYFEE